MSAHGIIRVIITRERSGMFTASFGQGFVTQTSATIAARELAAQYFGVPAARIELEPQGQHIIHATVRRSASLQLFWWIVIPLTIGSAAVAAFFWLTGGAR